MIDSKLAKAFPQLRTCGYRIASPGSPAYNCIAWAAREDVRCWWPDPVRAYYWPPDVPREETVDAFIQAFRLLGYQRCPDESFESGFEKIAIYTKAGKPTHAARQTNEGKWTSKLGQGVDIDHETLDGLTGRVYGRATCFLRRPRDA